MLALITTESIPLFLGGFVVLYLGMVALGRWLKRRAALPLGVLYQFFCLTTALYVPLHFLELRPVLEPFDFRRELGAASVMLGSIFVIALVRRFVFEFYLPRFRHTTVPKFLGDLVAVMIFLAALLIVLPLAYKVQVPGLLAGSGILTLVLGFAMQDLLGNILSGIALEIGKPFKPGDWLIVEKEHAEVIEVNWRSTRLRTVDDIYFDLPNKQVVGQTVTNLSYPTREHAMRLTVGVDYTATPGRVKELLVRAAANGFGVMPQPPPKAFLKEFGDSAVIYEVKYWMADHELYNDVTDSIRTNIWYELNRAGIKIPYPIRTLQLDRRPGPDPTPAIPSCLRRQPLFAGLTDDHFRRLLSESRLDRYGKGEHLILQGAEGASMFILMRGEAAVSVRQETSMTRVATLQSGDCFGETSLLTGEPRSATVTALGDCEVLEIEKDVFGRLLQDFPDLLESLSDLLAERRLETEGILASNAGAQVIATRQREYQAGFFNRLRSFFEL